MQRFDYIDWRGEDTTDTGTLRSLFVITGNNNSYAKPTMTRSSATTEKQRVSCACLYTQLVRPQHRLQA